jgi:hypothetical protein
MLSSGRRLGLSRNKVAGGKVRLDHLLSKQKTTLPQWQLEEYWSYEITQDRIFETNVFKRLLLRLIDHFKAEPDGLCCHASTPG